MQITKNCIQETTIEMCVEVKMLVKYWPREYTAEECEHHSAILILYSSCTDGDELGMSSLSIMFYTIKGNRF